MSYTRKIKLVFSPKVEAVPSLQKVRVSTGSWMGKTQYACAGDLSVYCAVQLVRELRRALRRIRDEETAKLANAVTDAEGGL